uniref:WASH complex subunit 4 n=1 Tax=Panagrolaimus sp. PS1159 TaxID=55785 RepID=A0AC35GGP7_9BILA
MESAREERAKMQLYNKFCQVLTDVKDKDVEVLQDRKLAFCSSKIAETSSNIGALTQSGNDFIDKITYVFGSLVVEVDLLVQEAKDKFIDALILYGEDPKGILEDDGGCVKMMADFLGTLQDLSLYICRCYEVVNNIFQQLHAFYNLPKHQFSNASDRWLYRVWKAFGDLLGILVQLDEIVQCHSTLQEHWKIYQKTMKMVQHNPQQFNAVGEKFKSLTNIIANLDARIMSGFLFQNCYEQPFPQSLANDKSFFQRFQKVLIDFLIKWEAEAATDDFPNRARLISLFALTIFLQKTGPTNVFDKKFAKNLTNTYKKLAIFQFAGDLLFTPCEFLLRHCPEIEKMIDKKLMQNIEAVKQTSMEMLCERLTKELQTFTDIVIEWKNEMKQLKTAHDFQNSTHQFLTSQFLLIINGPKTADKIGRLVRAFLCLHLNAEKALTKSHVQCIFRLIELIKVISTTIKFYWPTILECCLHGLQYWSGCILRILEIVRLQVSDSSSSEKLDRVSTLMIAENAMAKSPTKSQIFICGVSLEIGNYTKFIKASECLEIDDLLSRLETLSKIEEIFYRSTNTTFLYFHRSLAQIYFESAFEDYPLERIEYFCECLEDGSKFLKNAKHCDSEDLKKNFREEIQQLIQDLIVEKLCTQIENDLRIDVHSHQNETIEQLEIRLFSAPPKKSKTPLIPLPNQDAALRSKQWIEMKPFKLSGIVIDLKYEVEKYLEKTFYNLTAVALHDGETYAKMRQLAKHRYGLEFSSTKLPYMTIDQGLDVLMIMKNIHVFVTNYNYDLNEQMFIERTGKNRSLNVMHVQQVVNSIKTHGAGIVNSAINYAYQFLKKKFHIFSQFLFDDQIKCQLVKEIHYYKDSIDELNQMYPVKRAERFNTAISKLGVSTDGKTFLDKFRELITHIGNTIGFIRMIRSGVIESSAYASHFIPKLHSSDPSEDPTISSIVKDANGSQLSIEIAESLDSLIESIASSYSSESDYVEMLITVFAKEFRNYEKFSHLRNFFIIIPPLTINYVEHILGCRSKIGRRAQTDSDFTFVDDGFCLGIAYILTLLNQTYFFDSLNWFDSIFDKFDTEIGKAMEEQKIAQKRKDESFSQTLALRIQRLQDLQKEFQYLMYTLHSATMLFKIKDHENPEDEMYLEEF